MSKIYKMNFSSKLGILRITAVLEGLSWIALLITMTLKYGFDMPEPNKPIGQIHGFLFIAFVIMVILVALERKWNFKLVAGSIIASFLPFGTFVADAKWYSKMK